MTQTSHTPGPWFDCPAIFSDCGYPSSIKAVRTGASVALIISDNPQDAHLIAAAPDMLAALADLVRVWDENNGPDPIPEFTESGAPRNALIEKARAAIAKAKGE